MEVDWRTFILSETEDEGHSDDNTDVPLSSALIWRLPKRKNAIPPPPVTTPTTIAPPFVVEKITQCQSYKSINKHMQLFLLKYFSFCEDSFDHANGNNKQQNAFFSSLPSLLCNDHQATTAFFNPADYQLPSLRPMKKHLHKCRKRYTELERVTKLLQHTRRSTDANVQWTKNKLHQTPASIKSEDTVTTAATITTNTFSKGDKVDIGLTSYFNCPGTVTKTHSEYFNHSTLITITSLIIT
jgi:hypothetical protein